MRAQIGLLLILVLSTTVACGSQSQVRQSRRDFIAAFESGPEATRAVLEASDEVAPSVFFIDEVYLYNYMVATPVACHVRVARFKEDPRRWQHALAYYSYSDLIKHKVGLDTDTFFNATGQRRSSLDRHVIYHTKQTREVAEQLAEIWRSYGPELQELPPARASPGSCGVATNM